MHIQAAPKFRVSRDGSSNFGVHLGGVVLPVNPVVESLGLGV